MENWTWCVVGVAGAYLAGAIPFGFLVGKFHGVDVRTVGSFNIGATNVYRSVGKLAGLFTFACDFLKGFVPVMVALSLTKTVVSDAGGERVVETALHAYLPLAVGVATVFGHMFTCFMKFKGGKGVATAAGMLMGLTAPLTAAALLVFAAVVYFSHYVSLGSCLAAAFMIVGIWLSFPFPWLTQFGYGNAALCVMVTFVCGLAIFKHKSNIKRLLAGTENKIW